MPARKISLMKFLFVLLQLEAATVHETAWSKR